MVVRFRSTLTLAVVALATMSGPALGAERIRGTPIQIDGEVYEARDVSAVGLLGRFLVIASDERSSLQVLEEIERGKVYRSHAPVDIADEQLVRLVDGDEIELDLEGLAVDERTVYVIGSHSRKRSKVEPSAEGRTYVKNRDRLTETHPEHERDWLFRVAVDDRGNIDPTTVTRTTLRDAILGDPILAPFWVIPGKENGINIEGIAVRDKILYVGFRAPVLRENWVPILLVEQDQARGTRTRFVNLDGLGVRGMETVEDGLLLLAGPAGDADGEFRIYLWNGEDMIPGTGGPVATLQCLGTIEPFKPGYPESITRLRTSETSWEVVIAFDGIDSKNHILGRFEIPRRGTPAACD